MKHDARIDVLLYQITSKIIEEYNKIQTTMSPQELLTILPAARSANCEFRHQMHRERPASSYFAKHSRDPFELMNKFHSRVGGCNWIPALARDAAAEHGYDVTRYYTQWGHEESWGHHAVLIEIHRGSESALFLIDPTFRQFSFHFDDPDELDPDMPGYRLRGLNPEFHDQLLTKGYAMLTRERAHDYLTCLYEYDELPQHGAEPSYDLILQEMALVD